MCKYEFSPPITRVFKLFDNYSPKEKSSRDFSLPPLSAYAKMISSLNLGTSLETPDILYFNGIHKCVSRTLLSFIH